MGLQIIKRVQSIEEIQVLPKRYVPNDRLRIFIEQTSRYHAHHVHHTSCIVDVAHVNRIMAGLEIDRKNGCRQYESNLSYALPVRFTLAAAS